MKRRQSRTYINWYLYVERLKGESINGIDNKENTMSHWMQLSNHLFTQEEEEVHKTKQPVIQKAKAKQVREWLQLEHPGILLISGPTGCGKSEMIRTLCKELGIRIIDDLEKQSIRFKPLLFDEGEGIGPEVIVLDELWQTDLKETMDMAKGHLDTKIILVLTATPADMSEQHLITEFVHETKATWVTLNAVTPTAERRFVHSAVLTGDLRADLIDEHIDALGDNALLYFRDHERSMFHSAGHILHGKGSSELVSDREQLNLYLQYNCVHFIDNHLHTIMDAFSELDAIPWPMKTDEMHIRMPEWTLQPLVRGGRFQALKKPPLLPRVAKREDPRETDIRQSLLFHSSVEQVQNTHCH